jgi:hypothetical protein
VAGTWTVDRNASESSVMLTYEPRDAAESMKENIVGNAEKQREAGIEHGESAVGRRFAKSRSGHPPGARVSAKFGESFVLERYRSR